MGEVHFQRHPDLGPVAGGDGGPSIGSSEGTSDPRCAAFPASPPRASLYLFEGTPELRGDRSRHRPLDERGVRQDDARATLGVEQIQPHLRGKDRAPQVHHHEHTVFGPDGVDRGDDPHRVGADPAFAIQPAGGGDRDVLAAHLPREDGGPLGELGAVRDEH